ncbi:MAG TPA: pyridoxal-phosphate dependent enzyme [Gaiellaceae bacterium]|nr:pyridoxal-phosphate dependent enzyme [Gaiellaceae bacterium]
MISAEPVSIDAIERAARVIAGRVHRTPLLGSRTLSERLGAQAFLKAELFQRTGSFKARGALNRLEELTADERARGVITISAGNHAQAVAFAAQAAGLDALVVMWQGADESKVAATKGYGAAVDQQAANPTDAFARLDELQRETGRTLVHPFNDPAVIAGQGTVALEILEDRAVPDVVVVPVGGGGLVSGIATAVKARVPEARVIAVEPERSPALHAALAAGRSVPVAPESEANALNAPFAGEACVEICSRLGVEPVLVTEEELADAFRWLYSRTKMACELGAAASTAALLSGKVAVEQGSTVVAVVSGGNIAPKQAAAILAA